MNGDKQVFLDDLRSAPSGWIRTYTVDETIAHLEEGSVVALSLDYNLGPEAGETGAEVLRWIDRQVATRPDWEPPRSIRVHSTHRVGRPRMIQMAHDICTRMREQGREPPAITW